MHKHHDNIVSRHLSRRFQVNLVGEGALVGLAAGTVITLYRLSLSGAEKTLRWATTSIAGKPALMLAWFAFLFALLVVVCKLMLWEPSTSGSGIPQVDAEVAGKMDMPWHRVMFAKFIEGTLCALGGLSLGREGPSVQLGGMSGKAVSKALGRKRGEERLLVTCGAAAGMSAAFHAPLTGVLFAIEEIHKEFTAPLIISVMTSTIVSDFLVSQVLGIQPVLSLVFVADLPRIDYAFVAFLGLLCGVLGALHNLGMFFTQTLYSKIDRGVPYLRLAVPFALAGVMAFVWPELMCGGDAIIETLLGEEPVALGFVAALLLGKYLFTAISFGSGAPGGTLFPLVVMGACIGAVYALGVGEFFNVPTSFYPNFIALGIAGLFAAVVRAPVTAVVLVFELTGSLDALLSVSIVAILAYVVANLLKVDPFYEHLLANLLHITPDDPSINGELGEKVIHTIYVGAGSALEGMLVQDVPWPDQTRIVMIERAGQEIVPCGETRLMALDSLVMIMNTDTEDDAQLKLNVMSASKVETQRFSGE